MRFSIFQHSAVGGRPSNQDRMGYCFTRDSLLMMVADGMGGHLRGEVAAQISLQTTAALFQKSARTRLEDPGAFLEVALRHSHRELLRYQAEHALVESPRTTVAACVVQDDCAWWAHAGDSRVYWLRRGQVKARTRDHSKVQSLVSMGLLDPAQADDHPERNKVLNCLGSPLDPTIEVAARMRLAAGDVLLLCSDGVWGAHSDAAIAQAFARDTVMAAVPALVDGAVARGGRFADNATAIAMGWEGAPAEAIDAVSSLDVPAGAMTTTISLDSPAGAEAPLSDEDIERSIREIQAAIQRGKT